MDRVVVETLQPGDRFVSSYGPVIELLREPETWDDRFGIERLKLWCKRTDTGKEGYVTYGYGALVHKEVKEQE